MTTVADIQKGNYCENCDTDCRLFVHEADCCLYDTYISRLAVEVGTQNPNEEVKYEFNGQAAYLLIIENPDNIKLLNIIKDNMRK